jgi:MFS family permease
MSKSFIAYQGSSLLSVLGNTLTAVVLPLLVLQTTGSVLGAGWLALATGLPQFAAAALGGVALDRLNRRAVAVAGDLASAAAIGGLALIHATSGLNMTWFIVFGCLSAVGDVPAMTAREAMAPRLAAECRIPVERVVAVQSGLASAAFVAGPVIAGAMVGWGAQNAALWITAAMSTLAACAGLAVPRSVGRVGRDAGPAATAPVATAPVATALGATAPGSAAPGTTAPGGAAPGTTVPGGVAPGPAAPRSRVRPVREFAAGVRHLLVDLPLVRLATLVTLVMACTVGIVQGLAVPYMMLQAGHPGRNGVTLALFAAGVGVGAGVFAAAHRAVKPRALALAGGACAAGGAWLLALAPGFGVMLAAAGVIGAGSGMLSALFTTISVTAPAPELQGRVLGNQNALLLGAAPFAALAAAFAIERWSVAGMLVALAAVVTCTMAWAVASRSWRLAPSPGAGRARTAEPDREGSGT